MKALNKLFLWIWIVLPFGLLAYHYGPGKISRELEQVEASVALAQSASELGQWDEAVEFYQTAIQTISGLSHEAWSPLRLEVIRQQLSLAEANSAMQIGKLPESIETLEELLAEAANAEQDKEQGRVAEEIRATLAKGQYYASWLMRLEGADEEEWKVENESARQHYKWLAEKSFEQGQIEAAKRYQKNLEAVVRLARMDLSELQGLPLPKECSSCQNCSQKRRKQRESKSQQPKEGEEPPKDARSAGAGRRPDGSGS